MRRGRAIERRERGGVRPWRGGVAGILAVAALAGTIPAQEPPTERDRGERRLRELEVELRRLRARVRQLEEERTQGGGRRKGGDDELEALRREAAAAAGAVQAPSTPARGASAAGPSTIPSALNPRITLFGDVLFTGVRGTLRNEDGADVGDRFSARETELDLRADVDPYAKGVVVLALGEEAPGEFHLELEEGYASFEALPFHLRAKAGKFRTAFGRNNVLHTHDLPSSDRPLVVREMLGPEGDSQAGLSLEWLAADLHYPTLTATYQLVNGENDAVLAGPGGDHLAHVGRVSAFFDLPPASWLELGGSVMVGRAGGAGETVLAGMDVTWRWRPAERSQERSLLLQGEAFVLRRDLGSERVHSFGAYALAQAQPARRWYVGARGDWTGFAADDDGEAWSWSAWVSHYTTEFLRLRVGVEQLDDPRQDAEWLFFVQGTFVIGAHPPHPYWVNR